VHDASDAVDVLVAVGGESAEDVETRFGAPRAGPLLVGGFGKSS